MELYGPDGQLLEDRGEAWREGLPWDMGNTVDPRIYGVDRAIVRQRTRAAFFNNPLFGAAIEIAAALLIGDEFTYGTLNADKTAKGALDDFWTTNNLGHLVSSRLCIEYLLDGELCAVFPQDDLGDVAARVAHLDMHTGVRIEADTINGITSVKTNGSNGQPITWEAGQFVFTAHNALWNDPRGWPVAMRAVGPANAHLALMGHRLNVHALQGRLLGVQKVFIDRKDPNSRAIYQEKAGAYRRLPKNGGIVTLAMVEGKDGKVISDELTFTRPGGGASNAETDARSYVRLVALNVIGMPEHYLGEGGTVTRTTATSMTLPAIRSVKRVQGALRSHLDGLFRAELKRRNGLDRKYRVTFYEVADDGKTRKKRTRWVLADQIEVPWVFPAITQENLADLIAKAEAASDLGLASPQTLSGSLGFDPAAEADLMAAAGLNFGQVTATPTAKGTGNDPVPADNEGDPNATT